MGLGTHIVAGRGALSASFTPQLTSAFAKSGSDNLYIADTYNSRIQMVAYSTATVWGQSMTANDVYTVAGNSGGSSGYTGDGSAATSAYLHYPDAVSVGNGNQLYIADTYNNRVQEVARTSHTEWGVSMTANDVYTVAGNSSGTGGYTGDGSAATSAKLNSPEGLCVDGSINLYIADAGNNVVRQVLASNAHISTWAGDGYTLATVGDDGPASGAGLSSPQSVATDDAGNVYIADTNNNRIQEIAASTHTQFGISMTDGYVYTVAGSSLGFAGESSSGSSIADSLLDQPWGMAVDSAGNLYIADDNNNRVVVRHEVARLSGLAERRVD
jgi:trimeric autotransporter adhesin